jgi:hypothetical protein
MTSTDLVSFFPSKDIQLLVSLILAFIANWSTSLVGARLNKSFDDSLEDFHPFELVTQLFHFAEETINLAEEKRRLSSIYTKGTISIFIKQRIATSKLHSQPCKRGYLSIRQRSVKSRECLAAGALCKLSSILSLRPSLVIKTNVSRTVLFQELDEQYR